MVFVNQDVKRIFFHDECVALSFSLGPLGKSLEKNHPMFRLSPATAQAEASPAPPAATGALEDRRILMLLESVSCIYHVCIVYVSCMYHVCIMYVSCMS